MSGTEAPVEQPFTEEIAGWVCSWFPDAGRPAFEVACVRRNRREAALGEPVEMRLRFESGPRRTVRVQHRIWVVHDPAETQRMRWGEEAFRNPDDVRAWLTQVGLPARVVDRLVERIATLPTVLGPAE